MSCVGALLLGNLGQGLKRTHDTVQLACSLPPGPQLLLAHRLLLQLHMHQIHMCRHSPLPQVVKELRTEYGAAVAQTSDRMACLLAAYPLTSVRALLSNTTRAAAAAAGSGGLTPAQQQLAMERAAEPLLASLKEAFLNLKMALDSRVFVACGRGLWDFVAKQLFEFVECLQVRGSCTAVAAVFLAPAVLDALPAALIASC